MLWIVSLLGVSDVIQNGRQDAAILDSTTPPPRLVDPRVKRKGIILIFKHY